MFTKIYKLLIHDLTCLLNICGAIESTHIPLIRFFNKKMTLVVNDFFNIKNSKHFVMQSNFFGMYVLTNLVTYMM
jgi:hypothetical protein